MARISGPADGPVAVTGAAGYVGSHLVQCLIRDGYHVHGCVRDAKREDKTAHLITMSERGPGRLTIFEAGLRTHGVHETLRETCESLIAIAGIQPAPRVRGA